MSDFKISTWNCQSLSIVSRSSHLSLSKVKKAELRTLLHNLPDIFVITETRHLEFEANRIKLGGGISLLGHTPARPLRFPANAPQPLLEGRGGGGILIFSATPKFTTIRSIEIVRGQAALVVLRDDLQQLHLLFSVYGPTGSDAVCALFWDHLKIQIFIFLGQYPSSILHIIGDFNVDYRLRDRPRSAFSVQDIILQFTLSDVGDIQGQTEFTWAGDGARANQTSRIDYYLTSGPSNLHISRNFTISDHCSMTYSLPSSTNKPFSEPTVKEYILLQDDFLLPA